MPTGRPAGRGFTYVWLLFVLALSAAGLAVLGEQWQVAAQREREAELLFRGGQIADALARWRDASPTGLPQRPTALEQLIVDDRHDPPRFHLRRLYVDPFTGAADWVLVRDEGGGIEGVHSRSGAPALRRVQVALREGADPSAPAVGDWLFTAGAPVGPPPASKTRRPDRRTE